MECARRKNFPWSCGETFQPSIGGTRASYSRIFKIIYIFFYKKKSSRSCNQPGTRTDPCVFWLRLRGNVLKTVIPSVHLPEKRKRWCKEKKKTYKIKAGVHMHFLVLDRSLISAPPLRGQLPKSRAALGNFIFLLFYFFRPCRSSVCFYLRTGCKILLTRIPDQS